jgi:hypothetical protein
MKRVGKLHGMKIRVLQDSNGEVWLQRLKPEEGED